MVELSNRFQRALRFACELHGQQVRKGNGTPYVAHLLAVCALVLEHGGDEDEAIAALLHDAIEDQGGARTRRSIRRRFGPRVTAIVDACSDTDQTPKPPWRERKEAYLAHLPHADPSTLLVSAADKLHNLRCIVDNYQACGEALWGRFRGGRTGTLWYYRSLATIFEQAGPETLARELGRTLAVLEDLLERPASRSGGAAD